MTLNATSGYSTQFEQFVQFAQASGTSEKTIARLGANTDLADRSIVAADKGKDVVGGFSALFRKKEEKTANDATRDLFKQSVLAMFGNDINKVPKSVRQAMELGDYNLWDRGSDAHSTRGNAQRCEKPERCPIVDAFGTRLYARIVRQEYPRRIMA